MAKRIYNYLGEMKIAIEGSEHKLDRYERNIEEVPSFGEDYEAIIRIEDIDRSEIIKDKKFPYSWSKPNIEQLPLQGMDYYRYGTKIRTIWVVSQLEYFVKDYVLDDDGILDIFRRIYCDSNFSRDKALIHGSLLQLKDRGILVVGPCRSGKTTLTLSFLDQKGLELISEGISLFSSMGDKQLIGYYLPRSIYLRFSSITDIEKLVPLLRDYDLSESTQYFDVDAIKKIIQSQYFDVDAGITLSRKLFSGLMKIKLKKSSLINQIIFTRYSRDGNVEITALNQQDAFKLLRENEFPLRDTFGRIIHQQDIFPPQNSIILPNWLDKVDCKLVSFDGHRQLTSSVLEELLYYGG